MVVASLNGRRIYEARLAAGMTQADVAYRLRERGHDKSGALSVSRWEAGKHAPHADVISDLASVLGVSIETLYERDESDDEEEDEASMRRLAARLIARKQDDLALDLMAKVQRLKARAEKRKSA